MDNQTSFDIRTSELRTSRLLIRRITEHSAHDLQVLTNHSTIAGVVHYLVTPFEIDDALELIREASHRQECFLGAWSQVNGQLCGILGLHLHDPNQIEISYWIGNSHSGNGLATELVMEVVDMIRLYNSEFQIIAECKRKNVASWRVLEKAGFISCGVHGKRPGRELLIHV